MGFLFSLFAGILRGGVSVSHPEDVRKTQEKSGCPVEVGQEDFCISLYRCDLNNPSRSFYGSECDPYDQLKDFLFCIFIVRRDENSGRLSIKIVKVEKNVRVVTNGVVRYHRFGIRKREESFVNFVKKCLEEVCGEKYPQGSIEVEEEYVSADDVFPNCADISSHTR